jgi:hypothetical protein
MYVDHELSASEKLLVERFVHQYPYLKAELELLQEMVLPAEDVIGFDKNNLYRSAVGENLEESMLLYLDNELEGSAKVKLLQQIESDKEIKKSWVQLQKTKLDATAPIYFSDKTILYKSKPGRVLIGRFTKWSVAAALIAAGFFIGLSVIKKQHATSMEISKKDSRKLNEKDAVENNNTASAKDQQGEKVGTQDPARLQRTGTDKIAPDDVVALKEEAKQNRSKPDIQNVSGTSKISSLIKVKKQKLDADNTSGTLNILASNIEEVKLKRQEATDIKKSTASVKGLQKQASMNEMVDRNMTAVENSFAKTAVMNVEEKNDNHILMMDEEEVSHSKAGMFFKKLKRTVARTTNIKTGNSLKIAGFEFVVK